MVGDIVLALIIFFWVLPLVGALLLWVVVGLFKAFFGLLELIAWLFYDLPRDAARAVRRTFRGVKGFCFR